MPKTYVLDTNVLIQSPQALLSFEDNKIVLPIAVIEANFASVDLPYGFQSNSNDNRILKVCKGLRSQGEPVALVTKDIIVRLKFQRL